MSKSTPPAIASKWNARYAFSAATSAAAKPAEVLVCGADFLPRSGVALDLACGRGANAFWLASKGLDVSAWDISDRAIDIVAAASKGTRVQAEVRDVVSQPPQAQSFDVIVVSRFLDRSLCPAIEAALRPNGVLFYQTFSSGLSNPDYVLRPDELLSLFTNLSVCWYQDEPSANGAKTEAMLVARKPA